MFGMGFTEILFIAVVAILFLGPDKLPEAMVQIAKLFKTISKTVNEAKSSFEDEIKIKELREEALNYRRQYEKAASDISGFKNSLPNPAAEIQNAVSSIGGDRYLDDDILADIEEAENRHIEESPDEPASEESDQEFADKDSDDTSAQNHDTNQEDTEESDQAKEPKNTEQKPKKNKKKRSNTEDEA